MRRVFSWLAVCLLMMAGCQPAAEDSATIAMDWTVTPQPPAAGPVLLALTLTDRSSGQLLSGAEVRIEGDMAHPGMKPIFGTAREVAPGRYEVPVELTMAGDWVITVYASLRDGHVFEQQFKLRNVRPHPGGP